MLTATEHVQPESCAASHITDGAGHTKTGSISAFSYAFQCGKVLAS